MAETTVMTFEKGAAYVLVDRKLECADCGRSTACVVNRDGATRCYDCDATHLDLVAVLASWGLRPDEIAEVIAAS